MSSEIRTPIKQSFTIEAEDIESTRDDASYGFRGTIVTRWLNQQFERGLLEVGSQLPSYREIAGQTDVSVGTVQQVMASLEERGVVMRRPRRSCVIVRLPESLDSPVATRSVALIKQASPAYFFGDDAWTDTIFRSMESHLHNRGIHVLSMPINLADTQSLDELTSQLAANRQELTGVAIKCFPGVDQMIQTIESLGLPWVTLNPLTRHHPHNFVAAANSHGTAALAYTWARQGLRRVAFMGPSPTEAISSREKLLGLYEGFVDADVSPAGIESIYTEGIAQRHGHEAFETLFNRPVDQRPQAIVTTGDYLAAGAMTAALDRNIDVPNDLAIVGSTGLPEVSMLRPALTVLTQPMEEMGRQAADMLSTMRREGWKNITGRRVPCKLIVRESANLDIDPQWLRDEYGVEVEIE